MPEQVREKQSEGRKKKAPRGKIKLAEAMRQLLENKDFYSISTDEIAKTAGKNEALIYRYFGDKRGLLHTVLADYLEAAHARILEDLRDVHGSLPKLEIIIRDTFDAYCRQNVFAKIILVEVRNFPGYFQSDTYQLVRRYARLLVDTIKEGVAAGEIRDDIPPKAIGDMIIGGIEHSILPTLFFERNIDPDTASQKLFAVVSNGIRKQKKDSTRPAQKK